MANQIQFETFLITFVVYNIKGDHFSGDIDYQWFVFFKLEPSLRSKNYSRGNQIFFHKSRYWSGPTNKLLIYSSLLQTIPDQLLASPSKAKYFIFTTSVFFFNFEIRWHEFINSKLKKRCIGEDFLKKRFIGEDEKVTKRSKAVTVKRRTKWRLIEAFHFKLMFHT